MSGDPVDEQKRATLRRFAALGAASPLTRLVDRDESDRSDVRDAIAGYLAATPGAHFSKLRDDLQLGNGEAQYHLRRLVDAGAVETRKDGDYRRFFPAGRFSDTEQVALGYLRRETPRGMIVSLLADPGLSGRELAERLEVSRPTISKYAAELSGAGLLSTDDGYAVARPETLITLLLRHADSFDAETVAFAADAVDLISYEP